MTVASFTEQRARRAELLAELDASGAFLKQLCDDGATAEARRLAWDEYNAAYIELTKVETDIRVHELASCGNGRSRRTHAD